MFITAFTHSRATITRHKGHAICLEALKSNKPAITWARSHQENREPKKTTGLRMSGAIILRIGGWWFAQSKFYGHGKISSPIAPITAPMVYKRQRCWPCLSIGVEVCVWQQYLVRQDGYSSREAYWQDNGIPFATQSFKREYSSLSYAVNKIRIIYDKEWHRRHAF